MAEALAVEKGAITCPALERCLKGAISTHLLPTWNSTYGMKRGVAASSLPQLAERSAELSLWFFTFFVLRHSVGHTVVQIPYDALGQELTTVAEERQKLFGAKSIANFIGLFTAYTSQVFVAKVLATDVSEQALVVALIGGGMMFLSLLWMLIVVREKSPQEEKQTQP